MTFKLKHIATGAATVISVAPTWVNGMWECGDHRFTDPAHDLYEVEVDPVVEASPDLKAIARQLTLVVDDHIDQTAKALGYDSIVTAVSYADEPAVPAFQREGAALRAFRSRCYARLYVLQGEAMAGQRAIPTPTELIGLLPGFEAP